MILRIWVIGTSSAGIVAERFLSRLPARLQPADARDADGAEAVGPCFSRMPLCPVGDAAT